MKRPELLRPFRVPWGVRFRGAEVPVPSLVGAAATFAIWVVAMATHAGARYAGPAWLAVGLVVYGLVRRREGTGLLEQVASSDEQVLPETRAQSLPFREKVPER